MNPTSSPLLNPMIRNQLIATLALCVAACSGTGDAGDVPPAGAAASGTAQGQDERPADFSVADLAAYERGLARELALVRAAQDALDTATTPESRAALRRAQEEEGTIQEGARVSGLDETRYRSIRTTVDRTLTMLSYQQKIAGPRRYDTSRADDAMRQRLATDPYRELPDASAAALRARQNEIATVWGEYVRLTAVGG